ncbi:DUF722 domain-containing protein [Clostridium perfringens]|uniref:DUF722 domain-containing protein n=1 Tax=Clostridium perfringens TaxID=1502 RepID=UPI0013E29A00|nr:DUF722 domain-containing protein [Clostridium perfringens]MDB2053319.1 DUF722 domain-containing protein [Clostridium perfringens]MDK0715682.1 DUF722 domain-containing protein [Clostridium perfringens]MDM0594532.1 DUF722 domain-containing protein [Clostridium perfringens]MDM0597586.1 DUF722 domain-containing protein [Clostridium perfringens]MDM0729028.1 DUF722 domain-containing protein [Clostridium perfringens]
MINEEVKEIEKALYKYSEISTKINFINKEIEILKNEYEGCRGITYNEKESATNKFNSSVENEVIYRERELLRLNRELNRVNRFKNIMELCINNLYGADKRVIELRYLTKEKLTWNQIATRVSYSEDYCRKNIRARAINKIIIFLKNSNLNIYKYI